jgi:hypothetical protein
VKNDPIIFFDVDGPMVPGRALFLPKNRTFGFGWQFDPCAVNMLNFLAWAVPNLKAVIASHRIGCSSPLPNHRGTETRNFWIDIFRENGLQLPIHRDWVTVRQWVARTKFLEIDDWLEAHPDVTKFVVIDDEANGKDCVNDSQRSHFHLCAESYNEGITHADFMRMCKFFGMDENDVADKYSEFIISHERSLDKVA